MTAPAALSADWNVVGKRARHAGLMPRVRVGLPFQLLGQALNVAVAPR
jgi:hypothetical protein